MAPGLKRRVTAMEVLTPHDLETQFGMTGGSIVAEERITIGHRVILHGCTIGGNSLIGMGATVLNHARIGANCLVGANALVTEGKVYPDGSLIVGSPAVVKRELTPEQIEGLARSAARGPRSPRP